VTTQSAFLLLLFRISHILEDRLTSKAAGSLERLFDTVPQLATLVEVDKVTGAVCALVQACLLFCCGVVELPKGLLDIRAEAMRCNEGLLRVHCFCR